jgi:hypothetical protein
VRRRRPRDQSQLLQAADDWLIRSNRHNDRASAVLGDAVVRDIYDTLEDVVPGQFAPEGIDDALFCIARSRQRQYLPDILYYYQLRLERPRDRRDGEDQLVFFSKRLGGACTSLAAARIRAAQTLARGRSHQEVERPLRAPTVGRGDSTSSGADIGDNPCRVREVLLPNRRTTSVTLDLDVELEARELVAEVAQARPGE